MNTCDGYFGSREGIGIPISIHELEKKTMSQTRRKPLEHLPAILFGMHWEGSRAPRSKERCSKYNRNVAPAAKQTNNPFTVEYLHPTSRRCLDLALNNDETCVTWNFRTSRTSPCSGITSRRRVSPCGQPRCVVGHKPINSVGFPLSVGEGVLANYVHMLHHSIDVAP